MNTIPCCFRSLLLEATTRLVAKATVHLTAGAALLAALASFLAAPPAPASTLFWSGGNVDSEIAILSFADIGEGNLGLPISIPTSLTATPPDTPLIDEGVGSGTGISGDTGGFGTLAITESQFHMLARLRVGSGTGISRDTGGFGPLAITESQLPMLARLNEPMMQAARAEGGMGITPLGIPLPGDNPGGDIKVPEPGAWALLLIGSLGALLWWRRWPRHGRCAC